MTLRTPRRRISPQTKRRYRAIKGFFRRALGSLSQSDLRITSSIAINVTDLKHKRAGIEHQLKQDKHYQEAHLNDAPEPESDSIITNNSGNETREAVIPPGEQLKRVETKILYRTSESHYKKSDESDYIAKFNDKTDISKPRNNMNDFNFEERKNMSKINECERKKSPDMGRHLRQYKAKSAYENFVSTYSTSSFHSMNQFRDVNPTSPGCSRYYQDKKHRTKSKNDHYKDKIYKEYIKMSKHGNYGNNDRIYEDTADKHARIRKSKHNSKAVDEDFIENIIKRQYKPIKMFGRKESELSQFSAPVCRDGELCFNVDRHLVENPRLCPCNYGGRQYASHKSDNSDIRSVCDARLYSSKRNSRVKHRKKHDDIYNDADIYDLVPVKEKSSPKSRRKFFEDNMVSYNYYKEVPPSPRSHKPRLNLKAQYYSVSEDDTEFIKQRTRKPSPKKEKIYVESQEYFETYHPSEMRQMKNCRNVLHLSNNSQPADTPPEIATICSGRDPLLDTDENSPVTETPFNKGYEATTTVDKTDKALCEIKDILQNFLQEIKKEASTRSDNSEVGHKIAENLEPTASVIPNSGHSFNNFKTPHCSIQTSPYLPTFGNPCCYPIMPICPVSYMQNSYAAPSTSITCANCGTKQNGTNTTPTSSSFTCTNCPKRDETNLNENSFTNEPRNETIKNETDELIKEIYKFVSQRPAFRKEEATGVDNTHDRKIANSVIRDNNDVRQHDAKVGTPRMNCVSKSCEALITKMASDTYYSDTNASYSDTVIKNISVAAATATRTTSDTESSLESSEEDKHKKNKFTKVIKTLGLCKKNKKDVIEELSESENTVDVDVKKKPPYRQEVFNYMMHGQEYHQPPTMGSYYQPEYSQGCSPPYSPNVSDYPMRAPDNIYPPTRPQQPLHQEGSYHPQYSSGPPTNSPLSNSYESYRSNQMQPQVPLCLKEIEVKSIGCQSERKLSFFKKMTQKMQPVDMSRGDDNLKNCSTQTAQNKPGLFSWKNLDTIAGNKHDTFAYTYKTQKKLAEGDKKMRDAMLKKFFYKKNPFSPNNLIIRTLLGKDKSSYGDAPAMYRPRMFL